MFTVISHPSAVSCPSLSGRLVQFSPGVVLFQDLNLSRSTFGSGHHMRVCVCVFRCGGHACGGSGSGSDCCRLVDVPHHVPGMFRSPEERHLPAEDGTAPA